MNALERHAECLAQRLDEQSLAQPGNAFEQHMPSRKESDQNLSNQVIMANNDLLHLDFEDV